MVLGVDRPLALIEFPADDPARARRFWSDLLGIELAERGEAEGRGWQTHTGYPGVGIHERGTGPGDTVSLPYFTVADMDAALGQVKALAGASSIPGRGGRSVGTPRGARSGWPSTPSPRSVCRANPIAPWCRATSGGVGRGRSRVRLRSRRECARGRARPRNLAGCGVGDGRRGDRGDRVVSSTRRRRR